MKNTNNTNSTLPAQGSTQHTIFASDEKKLEFKSALKQENRQVKLRELVNKAPKLELKVLIVKCDTFYYRY